MRELFRNTSPGALTRAQAVAQQKEKAAAYRRKAEDLARQGRGEDTEIAHVARGEMVIPEALQSPEVLAAVRRAAAKNDIPFDRLRVGSPRNRVNPNTGIAEFRDTERPAGLFDLSFPGGIDGIDVIGTPLNPGNFINPGLLGRGGGFGLVPPPTLLPPPAQPSPHADDNSAIEGITVTAPRVRGPVVPQPYVYDRPIDTGLLVTARPLPLNPRGGGSSANPHHVDTFFDTYQAPITALANEMGVSPNLLLGLAAAESNWGRPQGKNNLFGFSVKERPVDFDSPESAFNAFRKSQWYSRLQNMAKPDDFTNELLSTEGGKKKYNSVNPGYGTFIGNVINTVDRRLPIWRPAS